jgi:hypothetical protein
MADVEQIELEPQDDEVAVPEAEAVTDETPESESAEGQESPDAGEPQIEATDTAELPAEPAEEAPESETEPFSFTADRRRFEVPGAQIVRFKEGDQTVEKIVMDRDAFARFVHPHIRDQSALSKRDAEHRRQIQALDPERNEQVIRAQSLIGSLEAVLKDEESLTGFLTNFNQNKELWALKAEKAVADARLTGYTTQESETQQATRLQETTEQVVQDIPAVLGGAAQFVTQNWQVPVDQRAMAAAQQQIAENIGAYYRYATAHDAQTYGVEEGQLIRDDDAVIKTVYRFASLLSQQNNAQAAKAKNQAVLGGGKKSPKTVSAKGSPGAAEKPKSFKNGDDWKRHMGLNT